MSQTEINATKSESIGGIPEQGMAAEELLDSLRIERAGDLDWRGGKAFSLVYNSDDPELERVQHEVAAEFLHENALNPFRYKTLLRMESEILTMAKGLFHAGHAALTSGGTESIFLAVLTARERAAARGVSSPTLVCAVTAHPAFAKACHYLGLEMIRTEVSADGRANPEAISAAIDDRTALVVASAPCYPFGVMDPIPEIAAAAENRDVLCHVDACLGGYLLPFWAALGQEVPPWDFRVAGVTSISADIHKYGYAFKGASTVLYRDRDLYQLQIFMYDSWPGGLYASSTAAGTRPGSPIAGAWATMNHLGIEGYMRLARRVLNATTGLKDGISAIDGLKITSNPDMSLFEFGVDEHAPASLSIEAVGDVMDDRGWNLDRQQGGLHVMTSPGHDKIIDAFVSDLQFAVANHGEARGEEHIYGGAVSS